MKDGEEQANDVDAAQKKREAKAWLENKKLEQIQRMGEIQENGSCLSCISAGAAVVGFVIVVGFVTFLVMLWSMVIRLAGAGQ